MFFGNREGGMRLNPDVITIEDCLEMYAMKDKVAIINDGKVLWFADEED